jgi:rubrerythrin
MQVTTGDKMMLDRTTDPREALRLAIQREQAAYEFYKLHAEIFENAATREMFHHLAEEEVKHRERLQDELDKYVHYEM